MSASSLAETFPVAARTESDRADAPRWSLATRLAFRFVFCFFLLSFLPFPLDLIPFVAEVWQNGWTAVVTATGTAVFGVTSDPAFNGSGDKLFHWIQLFVIAVVSAVATLVWSIAGRKAVSHPRLHAWFRVYLRFGLALSMIGYGAFKVIPSQFTPPSLDRLVQPFGDASPMGLLWTFMGASMAYTIFTGIGELAGGLLLAVRRTTLLGALITAGVMTHVVMLNFAYDVPVKIYSSQLLLAALVLAAPDARRLFDFFLRTPEAPLFARRKLRIAAAVLALLFIGGTTAMSLKQSWDQRTMIQQMRFGGTPLMGVWNVDELTVDGVARPPLTTDLTRWRRFVVSGKQFGVMQLMDDSRTRYALAFDEKQKTLTLTKRGDPNFKAVLHYRHEANALHLDGTFEGKKMAATLHKDAERDFLLNSRGFHWINETPFNR